jgi:hypothetical protein
MTLAGCWLLGPHVEEQVFARSNELDLVRVESAFRADIFHPAIL